MGTNFVMGTNNWTMTMERVANGWVITTGSGTYVATTPDEVTTLCQRWAGITATTVRPATDLDDYSAPRG